MVETVVAATEVAVEVAAAATAVAVAAMVAVATEVAAAVAAAVAMEAVATRPSPNQDHLLKKHFRFKISIHAYLVLFCYAVLSQSKTVFFLHLISDHFS